MKRIRKGSDYIVAGSRYRAGTRYSQSGLWRDDILCDTHERSLDQCDDYAARISRRLDETLRHDGADVVRLANPKPFLLTRFVISVIWRHSANLEREGHDAGLGPYKSRIAASLFADAVFEPEILLCRSNLVDPRGKPTEMAIAPYRNRLKDWTIWHMSMGGLDYYAKLDGRRFPTEFAPFTTASDPLNLLSITPVAIHHLKKFAPIFEQMLRSPSQAA